MSAQHGPGYEGNSFAWPGRVEASSAFKTIAAGLHHSCGVGGDRAQC